MGIARLVSVKMMPPENQPESKIAKGTGLSEATLYKWKRQAKAKGLVAPSEQEPERWSTDVVAMARPMGLASKVLSRERRRGNIPPTGGICYGCYDERQKH